MYFERPLQTRHRLVAIFIPLSCICGEKAKSHFHNGISVAAGCVRFSGIVGPAKHPSRDWVGLRHSYCGHTFKLFTCISVEITLTILCWWNRIQTSFQIIIIVPMWRLIRPLRTFSFLLTYFSFSNHIIISMRFNTTILVGRSQQFFFY